MTEYCGVARRQGGGAPCHKSAGWGTDHKGIGPCRLHGGNFANVAKAAERKRAEAELQSVLAGLGVARPVANPLEALRQLAGEILLLKDVLRGMVERLGSVRYDGLAGEQVRGEIQLYERALDRAAKVLVDIGRLNIDERLAAITQRQADVVVAAIKAGLDAAGVGHGEERTRANAAVAAELRKYGTAARASVTALPARRAGA
jgi:hypothetical protein